MVDENDKRIADTELKRFEVVRVFNQRWCKSHDQGQDFECADAFLKKYNGVMIAAPRYR